MVQSLVRSRVMAVPTMQPCTYGQMMRSRHEIAPRVMNPFTLRRHVAVHAVVDATEASFEEDVLKVRGGCEVHVCL